ncbi:ribosome biogenesis GTPase Der [Bacteroidota bacterium]
MGNIAAIVGRSNVGKSTLFNRLIERREAIVDKTSGVTRDRHYGKSEWNGIQFSVIDTGGYTIRSDDVFENEIRKQVILAIKEADVVIFMVDVLSGLSDYDEAIAELLRKSEKKVFLVVNKVDTSDKIYEASEFYRLGLGELYCVSSINGFGTGELLDSVVKSFTKTEAESDFMDDLPRFAIVGRPNVGKSSLLNALMGEERNIVTTLPGTTRDSIYSLYNKFNHKFYLVDTAGLRKKGKISDDLEFYSVMRSIRAIEYSDVCLLLIDAQYGMEAQDVNIFHVINRNRKGVVILVNKWDLVEKEKDITIKFSESIRNKLAPYTDVPIVFISALNSQRIHKCIEIALEVYNNRKIRIPTSKLNKVMLQTIEEYHPPAFKGKYIKIKYAVQLPTHAPSFAFYCNLPQYIKEPYKRYLEGKIRENFNFTGVPLQLFFRKK